MSYFENLFLPMAIDIASKDQKEEKSSSEHDSEIVLVPHALPNTTYKDSIAVLFYMNLASIL